MTEAVLEQIDKSIQANDTVLEDISRQTMVIEMRNEELRHLRVQLTSERDTTTVQGVP